MTSRYMGPYIRCIRSVARPSLLHLAPEGRKLSCAKPYRTLIQNGGPTKHSIRLPGLPWGKCNSAGWVGR
jgi:hypothetical protein